MPDVRDFLDEVYVAWPKTTWSESGYWEARPMVGNLFEVVAVTREQQETLIATGLAEADANFIVAAHAALPELIRQAHSALDEADRADTERDARECRIAELELEIQSLRKCP